MTKTQHLSSRYPVRLTAFLVLALLALIFGMAAVTPQSAKAATLDYGSLSRTYETGGEPAEADPDWGYGAYQMLKDTAYNYAVWLSEKSSSKKRAWGRALLVAHELDGGKDGGKYFNATYKAVAGGTLTSTGKKRYAKVLAAYKKKNYTGTYATKIPVGSKADALKLQYEYALKVYYSPAVSYWQKVAPGFDPLDYSIALRSVLFSTAIANGPSGSASKIFANALKTLGGWKSGLSEKKLINALYDEWGKTATWKKTSESGKAVKITTTSLGSDLKSVVKKYGLSGKYLKHYYSSSSSIQVSVFRRIWVNERADALALYSKYKPSACKHSSTTGGSVLKIYSVTDRDFKELVSKKKCLICGAVVSAQHVETVKSSYTQNGTTYKDTRSGHSYTVHQNKHYYLVTTALSLRKSTSTSSKRLAVLPEQKIVKTSSITMGKDGFWWGKVKVSGKTGWVQMRYLSIRGTASKPSYNSKNVNKYTGLSRKQTERLFVLKDTIAKKDRKLTLAKAATAYKAAYSSKANAAASYKAGKKLKAVKVVTNRYHTLYAELSSGTYVPLTAFK